MYPQLTNKSNPSARTSSTAAKAWATANQYADKQQHSAQDLQTVNLTVSSQQKAATAHGTVRSNRSNSGNRDGCIPSSVSPRIAYSEPIFFPKDVSYIVAQTLESYINLVIDPYEEPYMRRNAPAHLGVNVDSCVTFSDDEATLSTIQLGDRLLVSSFARVIADGQVCRTNNYYETNIGSVLSGTSPKSPALVVNGHFDLHYRLRSLIVPAVITNTVEKRDKDRIRFVSRYHLAGTIARPYQIAHSEQEVPSGSLVWTEQVLLPGGAQKGPNFVLPKGYRKQSQTEYVTDCNGESALTVLHYSPNPRYEFQYNPFSGTSMERDDEHVIAQYEDTLLAVNAFLKRKYSRIVAATAFKGNAKRTGYREFQIRVPVSHDYQLLARRLKYWQENTFMLVDLPAIENAHRAVIRGIDNDEYGNITLDIRMQLNDTQILEEMQDASKLNIKPDCAHTGFEFRIKQFGKRIVQSCLRQKTSNYRVLQALLGIPPEAATAANPKTALHHSATKLTEEQRSVIQCLLGDTPVLFQQAPAGTGKTRVIGAYMAELLPSLDDMEMVLVTATTNIAAINATNTILACVPDLKEEQLCFLQSTNAELIFPNDEDMDDNRWTESRLPETLQRRWQSEGVERDDRHFVRNYLDRRLPHKGLKADDSRALRITLSGRRQVIIAGTIAMVEAMCSRFLPLITHMIIDEAGMVPESQLLALSAAFPRLKQVFLTGDMRQLPPYRALVSENLIPFGARGAVDSIIDRGVVPVQELTTSFRSHPLLTQCLSVASYEGKLKPGAQASERTALTHSSFQLPVAGVPLVLLHQVSRDLLDFRKSRTNVVHEQLVARLVDLILKSSDNVNLVIICFYSGTKRVLEKALEGKACQIYTIDQFQGQEAQIVILVTTRDYAGESADQNLDFFLNPSRITVALSRAKDGLMVVGNFSILLQSEVWYRYIKAASKSTPIVTAAYLEAVEEGAISRNKKGLIELQPPATILSRQHAELNQDWM